MAQLPCPLLLIKVLLLLHDFKNRNIGITAMECKTCWSHLIFRICWAAGDFHSCR